MAWDIRIEKKGNDKRSRRTDKSVKKMENWKLTVRKEQERKTVKDRTK